MAKLKGNPPDLEVLGDGTQQKPYLHISDLLDAMFTVYERTSDALNYFNIGPPDEGASVLDVAQAVLRKAAPSTPLRFTGGNRGWVGDVPRFRYCIEKIKKLGWQPKLTSMQAVDRAVAEIYREIRAQSL
jgi:UDP-glucose 4-epimerase